MFGAQHAGQDRLLVVRTAAHAEAGGFETDSGGVKACPRAGGFEALVHGALESGAAFGGARVVAWAGLASAQYAAALVADQHRGAGLSTVHSQKQSHGSR